MDQKLDLVRGIIVAGKKSQLSSRCRHLRVPSHPWHLLLKVREAQILLGKALFGLQRTTANESRLLRSQGDGMTP